MAIGWQRRGCAFANATSEEQFALAMEDFDRVLALQPEQTHVYGYMIAILMNFSADDEIEQLYRKAMSVNPRSLSVRSFYLRSLQPRWGGSIAQMEAAVADARQYFDDYPALETLEAKVHAERGYAFHMSQQYESGVDDFNESIRLCPTDMVGYDYRGRARFFMQDYEGVVADMSYAIDHGNESIAIYQARGDSYLRLNRYRDAERDLDRALELDPALDSPYYADLRVWLDGRFRYEAECAAIPGCVPTP